MRLDFETILGIIFFIVFFILPAFNRKKKAQGDDTAGQNAPARNGDGRAAGQPTASGTAPAQTGAPVQAGRPAASARSAQRQVPSGRPATPYTIESSTAGQAGSSSGSGGNAPPAGSSVDEVLEEIRARIREAQRQENAQRGGGQRGQAQPARGQQTRQQPVAQTQSSGSLVSAQPSAIGGGRQGSGSLVSAPARTIGSTGSAAPQYVIGREGQPGQRDTVSAPLEVARGRKGMALEDGKALRTQRARQTKADRQGLESRVRRGPLLATDSNALITGMIWHEVLSEPAARRRLRRTRSLPLP